MKSSLYEYYKQKYKVGGKTPTRKTGMWYQNGDVVVPSNQITMKGPQGQLDYFDSPIMGTGMQSGQTQVMQPGEEYFFPQDEAVYERKMQKGGKTDITESLKSLNPDYNSSSNMQALELALAGATFLPPPVGTAAGIASAGINLAQGDFVGMGLDVAGIASGGTSKLFAAAMKEAKLAGAGRVARNMGDKAKFFNAASNPNIYKSMGFAKDYYSNNQDNSNARTNYKDNTRVAPVVRPVKPKMQGGGLSTKLSSSDEDKFSQFFTTLPLNLKVDNNSYDIRGYWDALGRPNAFDYSQPKEEDGMYHAFSRHPRSGKMLKSMGHPTAQMAVEGDKAAGYSHAMDPSGGVYSFSLEDMPTEGPFKPKMQMGAITKPEKMTLEQQARFNAYMAENSNSTIQTPEWLNLSSGATRFARRFNNMGTEELSRMPGDISKDVTSAFERGLDYSIDGDLGSLGRFSTDGNYNPFGTNTLESLYLGTSYENNSPNLGVRINPRQQELTLRGKGKQLKLKRDATDEETISELAFSLSPIGQALNVYGRGTFEGLGNLPNVNRKKPYSLEGINPEYNIQAGVRGEVGPLNYNVRGNYNPETGYRYNADAELSLLKNRLNLRGDVSGSKEAGLQSLSAEARARLAKGLSVKAGYSKSKDQPGSYNVGFSYTKAFQGGGMSIPGVQGSVVAAVPMSIKDAYKKKKKK